MTSQSPTYQAGLSGRVGALDQQDSLASLLPVRGGTSGFETEGFRERHVRRGTTGDPIIGISNPGVLGAYDDVRGGYVESMPMMAYRSREQPRTRRVAVEDEDLDDFMGQAADMEAVYGTRRLQGGSADMEAVYGTRRLPRRSADIGMRQSANMEAVHGTRRLQREPAGQDIGMREAADMEAVYGTRRLQRESAGQDIGMRQAANMEADYEDYRDRQVQRGVRGDVEGGYVRRGKSGLVEASGRYVESMPMTPSKSRGALRTRRAAVEDEDLDDMETVYRTHRLQRGSADQVGRIVANSDLEDFRERHVRRGARGDPVIGISDPVRGRSKFEYPMEGAGRFH